MELQVHLNTGVTWKHCPDIFPGQHLPGAKQRLSPSEDRANSRSTVSYCSACPSLSLPPLPAQLFLWISGPSAFINGPAWFCAYLSLLPSNFGVPSIVKYIFLTVNVIRFFENGFSMFWACDSNQLGLN